MLHAEHALQHSIATRAVHQSMQEVLAWVRHHLLGREPSTGCVLSLMRVRVAVYSRSRPPPATY